MTFSGPVLRKPWMKWGLIFLVWTLIGLAFASQFNFTQSRRGYIVTWKFALITALADWYVFALLSIPALWLSRRFRLEGEQWRRNLAVHVPSSVVFGVLWVALRVGVEKLRFAQSMASFDFDEMFHWTLARSFYFNVLVYWIIIGTSHAFEYYRRFRDRELEAIELEKLLVQARLETLQAQLNPHFLFNTLNSIASLMRKDVDAADRMIVRLSDLLRQTLRKVATQEVPLRDEINFLKSYLEIEQARFGNRLTVRFDTPAQTLAALVPNLVLQPLVENAIKHGLSPRSRQGHIEVRSWQNNDRLHLSVRDNGAGQFENSVLTEGVGLSNTRARLEHLYGEHHRFEFGNAPDGGFLVEIDLPFRLPDDEPEPILEEPA